MFIQLRFARQPTFPLFLFQLPPPIYIPFFPFILINKSPLSFMFIHFKYLSALLLSPFSHCLVWFMFSSWQLPSDIGKKKISSSVRYSFGVRATMYIFRTVYRGQDVDGEILLMSTAVLLPTVLGP